MIGAAIGSAPVGGVSPGFLKAGRRLIRALFRTSITVREGFFLTKETSLVFEADAPVEVHYQSDQQIRAGYQAEVKIEAELKDE